MLNIIMVKVCDFANKYVLQKNRVIFANPPNIHGGIIIIHNEGEFSIGRDVNFTCSTRINMAGLYKTCSFHVSKGASLSIGHCSGFSGCSIVCESKIVIGAHGNFGANVSIFDTDFHPLEHEMRRIHDQEYIRRAAIEIGDDVFIGANSIILKGAKIGDRSIVGAGSVVTSEIPSDQIWAGNPAKFIRNHPAMTPGKVD